MNDSRGSDSFLFSVLAVLALVLLLSAGGVVVVWMMSQSRVSVAREQALAAQLQAVEMQRLVDSRAASGVAVENADVAADTGVNEAVVGVLKQQQDAWNAGDIDRFMSSYWKSDQLTFSSGGKVTRSWQGTLDGYKERYPTRERMGELAFKNLEVTPLGSAAALVLGEWNLLRDTDAMGGTFSLVFRLIDGHWVIVHDHTSRTEDE